MPPSWLIRLQPRRAAPVLGGLTDSGGKGITGGDTGGLRICGCYGGRVERMDVWIGLVGACAGSIVTGFFNWLNNRGARKHAERMATLDKRLEAHQELYSQAHKMVSDTLISSKPDGERSLVPVTDFLGVLTSRRLYIGETVNDSLTELWMMMEPFDKGTKSNLEIFEQLRKTSGVILSAMDLPPDKQEGIIRDPRTRQLGSRE